MTTVTRHFLLIPLFTLFLPCLLSAQIILPTPEKTEIRERTFRPTAKGLTIYCELEDHARLLPLCEELFAGIPLSFSHSRKKADIRLFTDSSLQPEAYRLDITSRHIDIYAGDHAGYVYAIQTLRQWKQTGKTGKPLFGCVKITDRPRLRWRGFLLDSGRQYQSVGTIKKYIDMVSMLKMNCFHWHLTEGLGWRVEILQYPQLTRKGAYAGTEKGQQGFYSRREIKEIVKYAADRGVTVVPEIDMPGHAEAALYAYPELGCFNQPVEIPQNGFTQNIFCAGKDSTLQFLKNVLDEICELFPSPYIHLGGDEAPKENWNKCPDCRNRIKSLGLSSSHKLQLWFSAQMAAHLKAKGRKAIFWGDVVYKDGYPLPDNTVIQWWNYRGKKDLALNNALRNRHQVICSPNYYTYLNFPLTPWRGYGKERTFDLRDVYTDNPASKATHRRDTLIMGMECALWTDYGLTEDMMDQRLFPRIIALAEQMWHNGRLADFDTFLTNIMQKKNWFEKQGYIFGPAMVEDNTADHNSK